jgi:hypothetical protein
MATQTPQLLNPESTKLALDVLKMVNLREEPALDSLYLGVIGNMYAANYYTNELTAAKEELISLQCERMSDQYYSEHAITSQSMNVTVAKIVMDVTQPYSKFTQKNVELSVN